jgi:endoglucanase
MASKDLRELISTLDNVVGVSGRETAVAEKLKEEMAGYCDEVQTDNLGDVIFKRSGNRDFTALLIAHMDELGFIVSYIEENGMVRFLPVGYHDDRMAVNQDLVIHTKKGPVSGVSGAKPSHVLTAEESAKAIPMNALYIDIGTSSREETAALGVRPGCVVSFDREGRYLNGGTIYTGKSVDDRVGCAMLVEVIRRLAAEDYRSVTVVAAGSVMEEVGARGAHVIPERVKPDLCIVLDLTLAGGSPDVEERELPVKLGGGPAIMTFHWELDTTYGLIAPEELVDGLLETAEKEGIPIQYDLLMGAWTDGFPISMSGKGVKTCGVSVPSRYVHTAVGLVDISDVENAVDLVVAYIKSL